MTSDGDDRRVVIDCPICKRTVWANSRCDHGAVPPPRADGTNNPDAPPGPADPKPTGGKPPKTKYRPG